MNLFGDITLFNCFELHSAWYWVRYSSRTTTIKRPHKFPYQREVSPVKKILKFIAVSFNWWRHRMSPSKDTAIALLGNALWYTHGGTRGPIQRRRAYNARPKPRTGDRLCNVQCTQPARWISEDVRNPWTHSNMFFILHKRHDSCHISFGFQKLKKSPSQGKLHML